MPNDLRCLVCHGLLTNPYRSNLPDFPGDTRESPGQTLTMAPVIGEGPFLMCERCGVTYRIIVAG